MSGSEVHHTRSTVVKRTFLLISIVCTAGVPTSGSIRTAQGVPEGRGAGIIRATCTGCHEADLIGSQRLSRAGWEREVEKMMRWGAAVPAAERDALLDYLAGAFGPFRPSQPVRSNEEQGKATFDTQCVRCHEADLTRQQRLSHQAWTAEVEKMIRWGATVTESEKESLVKYLVKDFGPSSRMLEH